MAHGSDHPNGFIDLLFPATDDHGALGHDVGTAVGQGDAKGVDAALDAQPFRAGGGQGVGASAKVPISFEKLQPGIGDGKNKKSDSTVESPRFFMPLIAFSSGLQTGPWLHSCQHQNQVASFWMLRLQHRHTLSCH